MKKKDFIELEKAKANTFNLFTALLCQPEDELINNRTFFDALEDELSIVAPGSAKLALTMQQWACRFTSQELLIEYAKLFIGPFRMIAPPYSSLYFGSEYLMSDVTLWVADVYRKAGVEMNEKIKDLPDHIAVETEFFYYLIFHEIRELKKGKLKKARKLWEIQDNFFKNHYRKWVPQFCKKIIEGTNNDYYRALAQCFEAFISEVPVAEFPL